MTSLRVITEQDLPLLCGWFADAEFVHWWGGIPLDAATVARKYLGRRPDVDSYLIEEDGDPVGYGQTWIETAECGVDLALVPSAQGRGIGVDAIKLLANKLRRSGRTNITADPDETNARSIGAFMKAGFVPTGEDRDHHVMLKLTDDRSDE